MSGGTLYVDETWIHLITTLNELYDNDGCTNDMEGVIHSGTQLCCMYQLHHLPYWTCKLGQQMDPEVDF